MTQNGLTVGINEKPKSIGSWIILSFQHVFAMFGATVLVPMLTGLDVGVALVASGIGTLIYILCTKGKVPVYLGSSFAYITTISAAIAATGSASAAYLGLMVVGLIYVLIALIIFFVGSGWLKKIVTPPSSDWSNDYHYRLNTRASCSSKFWITWYATFI